MKTQTASNRQTAFLVVGIVMLVAGLPRLLLALYMANPEFEMLTLEGSGLYKELGISLALTIGGVVFIVLSRRGP